MKQVAKLIIVDNDDNYLVLYRFDHPIFGNDADLPGGTLEEGESPLEALRREVQEETGIDLGDNEVRKVYAGAEYSRVGTHYVLFVTKLAARPKVNLSWEHTRYEWLPKSEFLHIAQNAKDRYMHMVHDVLQGTAP